MLCQCLMRPVLRLGSLSPKKIQSKQASEQPIVDISYSYLVLIISYYVFLYHALMFGVNKEAKSFTNFRIFKVKFMKYPAFLVFLSGVISFAFNVMYYFAD